MFDLSTEYIDILWKCHIIARYFWAENIHFVILASPVSSEVNGMRLKWVGAYAMTDFFFVVAF